MHRERNRLLSLYATLVYAFLFAPIVVLVVFGFNDRAAISSGAGSPSTGTPSCCRTTSCSTPCG
jgi:ABC-type spermidine/putrescine transport system permease subunit II